jgi:hypothetical protein
MTGLVGVVEDVALSSTSQLAIFGTDLDLPVSSRDDGPCHVEQAYANSSAKPVSAGTVTVSGGSAPIVMLVPDANNQYFAMATGLSYVGGDQLSISAAGATVPTFSSTAGFPATVTVTSSAPTLLHKSGLTVTWNATTSPVTISVTQYPSGAPKLNVACIFDGSAGTGTIPGSALMELATSSSAGIAISTRTDVRMMIGDYAIELLAVYGARISNVPVQL